MSRNDWSEQEVRVAVVAYLSMLQRELRGERINKAATRRAVLPQLDDRSNGSLEFKNQNISAALLDMGYPCVKGYKPRGNYQRSLLPRVLDEIIRDDPLLPDLVRRLVLEDPPAPPHPADLLAILDSVPPEYAFTYSEGRKESDTEPKFVPRQVNFLEMEARNAKLGRRGEELVVSYERTRLSSAGKDDLADRVEHTSLEYGDGAGFDIRSFDLQGKDHFIEVKTTRFHKETPFFISANEIEFSRKKANSYSLYRVFEFRDTPRLFTMPGDVTRSCALTPTQFRGEFGH